MALIISAIKNIWEMGEEFCCFCFINSSDPLTHIDDLVYIIIKETETYIPMSEILCTLLDYEVLDYLTPFKQICKRCTQLAVNSYIFIKTTKLNAELLTNAISSMLKNLHNDQETQSLGNKLFLVLNTENFVTKQFYNVKKPSKLSKRRKRNTHSHNNSKVTQLSKTESNKRKISILPIRTKDILYEDNDESIRCKVCLKSYSSLLILRNHFIRVHAPKIYKCDDCNKKFGSPAGLEMHKSDHHSTYICSECGKTYKSIHKFKTHEMSHNSKIVCPDCGRAYKNKVTYRKHIELNICSQKTRASPADAKFTCDYCKKRYTQKASLRVHVQSEHLNYKNHYCKYCNKKFWAQSRLKAHMVKHTKERNFPCAICNRKFVTKEALLYHTRIHTGERPYECSSCKARFLSASRRAEHVKRHHLNATIECDICHNKFSTQSYLQQHRRSHLQSETNVQSSNLKMEAIKSLLYSNKDNKNFIKLDSKDVMDAGTYNVQFLQEGSQFTVYMTDSI